MINTNSYLLRMQARKGEVPQASDMEVRSNAMDEEEGGKKKERTVRYIGHELRRPRMGQKSK